MKTKTPPPTIADLWWVFIGLDKVNRSYMSHPEYATARIERHAQLRQQLLERCKNEPSYMDAHFAGKMIEYHKELSAYHAFWAWELEQRENEAANG